MSKENKEELELNDEELEKVNGGINNIQTAQSMIDEFMLKINQNSTPNFTSQNKDVSIEFVVPTGRKN